MPDRLTGLDASFLHLEDAAVNVERTVGTVALDLIRRLDPRRPVRLLGVRVAGLDEAHARALPDDQLSLSL